MKNVDDLLERKLGRVPPKKTNKMILRFPINKSKNTI